MRLLHRFYSIDSTFWTHGLNRFSLELERHKNLKLLSNLTSLKLITSALSSSLIDESFRMWNILREKKIIWSPSSSININQMYAKQKMFATKTTIKCLKMRDNQQNTAINKIQLNNLPQSFTRIANRKSREHPKSINFDIFFAVFYF